MQRITLLQEPFSVERLQDIYFGPKKEQLKKKSKPEDSDDDEEDSDSDEEEMKKVLVDKKKQKRVEDAINYIFTYYFEIEKGTYYKYEVDTDEFRIVSNSDFKLEVLDKIGSRTFTKKVKMNNKIYKVVAKIWKPRFYIENGIIRYINEAGAFLHETYKPYYSEYSDETKSRVELVLKLIKDVAGGGDDERFDKYMIYYGQIARGMKTDVIIYRKSYVQGIGKSTETSFVVDYVFGSKLGVIMTDANCLTSEFNKMLMGKLFVVFEELPVFTDAQWNGVSAKLKTLTTEKSTVYRDLFKSPINLCWKFIEFYDQYKRRSFKR